MPLIKSKSDKAFKKNIAAEVKAGKPVKQAVAIAYSTKRAAKKAVGGSMDPMHYDSDEDYYNALSAKGLKRPRPYTKSERDSIISGDIMKGEHAKERATNEARQKMYAANAGKNAEYEKKMKEFVNETRKRKGMTPLKSGGSASKKSCGGW